MITIDSFDDYYKLRCDLFNAWTGFLQISDISFKRMDLNKLKVGFSKRILLLANV